MSRGTMDVQSKLNKRSREGNCGSGLPTTDAHAKSVSSALLSASADGVHWGSTARAKAEAKGPTIINSTHFRLLGSGLS